ncbi:MAG: radical SAM protein [Chloroflexia bacterium]|nr:radical SAM protein [Chloroflexia bacterium]
MNRIFHALEGVFHAVSVPKTPTDLIFFVTDRCNARCGHCFFRYAIDASDGQDALSMDEIGQISRSLQAPLHSLVLTGGEPFLRADLAEICQLFFEQNQAEMIVLPTNGLLTERIRSQVQKICTRIDSRIYVQVSLDGLGATHDTIRGVQGAFQRVLDTVQALQKLQQDHDSLYVAIDTTISQLNLDQVEPLADFVRERCAVPHSFELVRGTGFQGWSGLTPATASPAHPPDAASQPPSLEALRALYPLLDRIYRRNSHLVGGRRGLEAAIVYAYRLRRFWHLLDVVAKSRPFHCPAGGSMGVIYPSGEVALCELTKPVGKLSDVGYNLPALWWSEPAQSMREHIRHCYCTHGCFQSVAMMREPKMYGLMLASALRYLGGTD